MHTVWKGAISFGLVHVPVKMYAATDDNDISFKTLHKACNNPISHLKTCTHCNVKVDGIDIAKGYEYEKGQYVIFSDEEIEKMKPESARTIQILSFAGLNEIDPIYFDKTYYLSPDLNGSGAYNLLLEAIRQSGKIGIAKIAIRSKSKLAAIRAVDNCICLETMHFPDEIRPLSNVPALPEKIKVDDKELKIAKILIDQLSDKFNSKNYKDEYRDAILSAIDQKITGKNVDVVSAPTSLTTNVVDLMAALQASLDIMQPTKKPKKTKKTDAVS